MKSLCVELYIGDIFFLEYETRLQQTHLAHLRVIPKSFFCHFSESASTNQPENFHLYTLLKETERLYFRANQRETFPQLLLSSGNSLRSRIHPDSLLLGLQGVFEAHHLLEAVPSFPLLHRVM